MTQIVYIDEYLPSKAVLTIGDPIYKQSIEQERIRVGAPSILAPIAMGIGVGAGILAIIMLGRRKQ